MEKIDEKIIVKKTNNRLKNTVWKTECWHDGDVWRVKATFVRDDFDDEMLFKIIECEKPYLAKKAVELESFFMRSKWAGAMDKIKDLWNRMYMDECYSELETAIKELEDLFAKEIRRQF